MFINATYKYCYFALITNYNVTTDKSCYSHLAVTYMNCNESPPLTPP